MGATLGVAAALQAMFASRSRLVESPPAASSGHRWARSGPEVALSRTMRNAILLIALIGCSDDVVAPITDVDCVDEKCDGNAIVPGVAEQRVFPSLTFSFPAQMVFAPNNRAFVVEHSGKIKSFDVTNADHADVALDLTA